MDVRRAEQFLAVVKHGGITRAASALYLSQPSLSLSIRSLERELGMTLFVRSGHGLVLTDSGRRLIPAAERLLESVAEAGRVMKEVRSLRTGTLTIAAAAELVDDPLAAMIGLFRQAHPGVVVEIVDSAAAGAPFRALQTGHCDVELSTEHTTAKGLTCRSLGTQRLLLVAAAGFDLPGSGPLPLGDLSSVPMILTPPGTPDRLRIDAELARCSAGPMVVCECGPREMIWPLVLDGVGVAILPPGAAAAAAQQGMTVRETAPPIERQLFLVHRAGPNPPALEALLTVIAAGDEPQPVR
ncbi:LysR family transcriptional regulator [Streptomyces sp. NBC_00859]|uniref:LysR family transcriptional regulator n=1 Tax=Streptomyces sp. NBC_00859 TaxID=2903682 RepID=UPI00386BD431|nr:LysR family transcriptional regulator [Streptomyces sp. NBC_00859]